MENSFVTLPSIEKYPSPRKIFLCPDTPANGGVLLAWYAADGLENAFGEPSTMWWPPDATFPSTSAKLCVAQSVPQPMPSVPENGSPLVQCTSPDRSHPPTKAFRTRLDVEMNRAPFPNGKR